MDMAVSTNLCIDSVVPSTAVSHSAEMVSKKVPGSFLVYTCGKVLYSIRVEYPRRIVSRISVNGEIVSLRVIRGGFAVLVIYSNYGSDGFCVVENPQDFSLSSAMPIPAFVGDRLDSAIVSNESENLLVFQLYTGSVHIISSQTLECQLFILSSRPFRSLALINRGVSNWALAAASEQFEMYEIEMKNSVLQIDRINKIPLTGINPYSLFINQGMLLLIGGDGVTFSEVSIVSLSSIFDGSIKQLQIAHCQPMPAPVIAARGSQFVIATALGDVYQIGKDLKCSSICPPIRLSPNGPSTLTVIQDAIFVGQTMGDSVLVNDTPNPLVVVRGAAPVLDFAPAEGAVFFVSGFGRTAAVNRVFTNSLSADKEPAAAFSTDEKFLGVFHAANNITVFVSSTEITTKTKQTVLKTFATKTQISVCAFRENLLIFASGSQISILDIPSSTLQRVIEGRSEVSALSVWGDFVAIGCWDGSVTVVSLKALGSPITLSDSSSSLPRSVWLGDQLTGSLVCAIGFANGDLEVYAMDGTRVFTLGSNRGVLPVELCQGTVAGACVLFVGGSRPGVLQAGLQFRHLVLDGELTVLRKCVGQKDQVSLWRTGEFLLSPLSIHSLSSAPYVQAQLLGDDTTAIPLSVGVCGSVIVVVCTDSVQVYDAASLVKLTELKLAPHVISSALFASTCLLGTTQGVLLEVEVSRDTVSFVGRPEQCCEGAILGVAWLGPKHVAVIVGRTLSVIKRPALLAAEADTDFLAVTLRATPVGDEHHVVVGDVARSQTLFVWDGHSLVRQAGDPVPTSCVSSEVDDVYCYMGDDAGNLYVSQAEEGRLVRTHGANLNESPITAIRKSISEVWIGSRDGCIHRLHSTTKPHAKLAEPCFPTDIQIERISMS